MSDWRKIAFDRIIDHAVSIMSNRICSDTPKGIINFIPQDERVPLSKEFEEYNSDGKDFDGTDSVTGQDWILLRALWNRTENQLAAAQAEIARLREVLESVDEFLARTPMLNQGELAVMVPRIRKSYKEALNKGEV